MSKTIVREASNAHNTQSADAQTQTAPETVNSSNAPALENHRPFDINCAATVAAFAAAPFLPTVGILNLFHVMPELVLPFQPILNLAGWLALSTTVVSILEHQIHGVLMHKRTIPKYEKTFIAHAITHHKHYVQSFTDEPVPVDEDTDIRLTVLKAPIKTFPVVALCALFSLQGAMVFAACVFAHHLVWNAVHLEMHKPEGRFFSNWAAYKYICRYHFLHHKHPDKNFNVAIPIGDFLFGTYCVPNEKDKEAMRAEGFL